MGGSMRIAVIAQAPTFANEALVRVGCHGADWSLLTPAEALETLSPGDCAIGRIDVLPTLDGVDDGLWALGALEARGVTVLNGAPALLAAHDKLLTARLLRRAAVPHPRTWSVRGDRPAPSVEPPAVVKPRHGSWGRSVALCTTRAALDEELDRIRHETWYRAHGAILQELVPPVGHDLRLVVAGHRVVGAVRRVAAAGEWRTNVALGAERVAVTPPPAAIGLALAATRALGTVLAGVDLLPTDEGFVVLEVNGAVEFTADYRPGGDVFHEAALEIGLAARAAVSDAGSDLDALDCDLTFT